MTEPPSSQAVISGIIVFAVTVIGIGALIVAAKVPTLEASAFGIAGTVVGGLLAALQTPGSLTNAIKNILPPKVPPQ